MRRIVASILMTTALVTGANAAEEPQAAPKQDGGDDGAFGLGKIIVYGTRAEATGIGSDTVTGEALYRFNRTTLDDAVGLMPGVAASNSGGSRNERLISVRGFDRFQVPLSIDGIRVYLPADNRLDFGRFLTPDIAQIQVAKGYASVLDGPGAMGGAINLVTRTPSKELEAEGLVSGFFDDDGGYAGSTFFGLVGTRQGDWYAQASGAWQERDHFTLSSDFTPTATENGGARERSDTEDWRVNLKVGVTPREGDEYSLNYTRQEGSKNAPLHVTDPLNIQRFWNWPYWNLESVYFLSTTGLADGVDLKLRAYHNTFDNLLRSFDNAAQTIQTLPRAFDSYYDDTAIGGSAELGFELAAWDTLRIAFHGRRDEHVEWQKLFPSGFTEPEQVSIEDTYSLAVENTMTPSPGLTILTGLSYDWRDLREAEDFASGAYVFYPIEDADAWNVQAAIKQQLGGDGEVHASISSRTRFPTLFERFSSRFGGATSNPDLAPERAVNYEIGASGMFGSVFAEGALFYSDVSDLIVAIPIIFAGQPVTQSQNVGAAEFYGFEAALTAYVSDAFTIGGNYTFIEREVDNPGTPGFEATGVPKHKAFAFAKWTPVSWLRVTSSLDIASDRWTVTTNGLLYYETGAFTLANLRADVLLTDDLELGLAGRNLFDENYLLTDGFPEQGRSLHLTFRARL